MTEQELLSTIHKLQQDIDELKRQSTFSSPTLDPTAKEVLNQQIAIPYVSSDPTTTTPHYNGVRYVWKSGSDYKLSIYADGGWRTMTIGSAGAAGGSDTQVQFNDSGAFGGDAGLTYDKTSDILKVNRIDAHSGNNFLLIAPNGAASGNAGRAILLDAGNGNGAANGGGLFISSGNGGATSGNGGALTLDSGAASAGNSAGGLIGITTGAGKGTGAGVVLNITAGSGDSPTSAPGGDIFLSAGGANSSTGRGGNVEVAAGTSSSTNGNGGQIIVSGGTGNGTGNGGTVEINGGAKGASGLSGEVTINRGTAVFLKTGMDTMTYAATISLDVSNSSFHKTTTVDATGNATINASGAGNLGQIITILITND